MRVFIAWLLDLFVIATCAIIGFVLVTGGGVYPFGGFRVSLRTVDNPITALTALLVVRYTLRHWAPFVGVGRLSGQGLDAWCARTVRRLRATAPEVSGASGARLAIVLAAFAFALKAWFAATSPGFFSGDDVEVHEMTLGTLFGHHWPIWDLRSPIFPFACVFPAQWAAHSLGTSEVGSLVIAGRLMIAALSTLAVWLTWRIGAQLWSDERGYGVLAAALVATAKLQTAFGSSELPRPVSMVLILSAFLLLRRRSRSSSAAAGMVIGCAACLRFSEVVFVVPAAIELLSRRRYSELAGFISAAALAVVMLLAIPDQWYWGQPFHSVRAAIDFTLVRGLSSRGFQPAWFYIASIPYWTTIPLALLAAVGARRRPQLTLWIVIPIIALSVLPHKEVRYLIPVVPFACLLATEGVRQLAALSGQGVVWAAPAVIGGLVLGLIGDATHYRLPRSNEDVMFARRLAAESAPTSGLLVQQLWRLGGHLYFGSKPVRDLDPLRLSDPEYLPPLLVPDVWVVLDRRPERVAAATLAGHGFRPVMGSVNYVVWKRVRGSRGSQGSALGSLGSAVQGSGVRPRD